MSAADWTWIAHICLGLLFFAGVAGFGYLIWLCWQLARAARTALAAEPED
jgi:threonine/homoserine/homoserine lactone efflux protein